MDGNHRMRKANVSVGVAGRYALQKAKDIGCVDAATGLWLPDRQIITPAPLVFDNIITNTGMNHLGSTSVYLNNCHVGTGTATEQTTDTALGTFVFGKAYDADVSKSYNNYSGSAPYFGRAVRRYEFNPGQATGNISEIGISTTSTTGNLFSRARVKDGGGSPTDISVLSDEYLYVDYEFRVYPAYATADLDSTVSTEDFLLRAARVTTQANMATPIGSQAGFTSIASNWGAVYSDDAALGVVTAAPTASDNDNIPVSGNASNGSYVDDNYYRDITYVVPPSLGNFGASNGIKGILFYTTFGSYQMLFDLEQAKDATEQATLVIRLAWARATIP